MSDKIEEINNALERNAQVLNMMQHPGFKIYLNFLKDTEQNYLDLLKKEAEYEQLLRHQGGCKAVSMVIQALEQLPVEQRILQEELESFKKEQQFAQDYGLTGNNQ